jgi:cytochrome c553
MRITLARLIAVGAAVAALGMAAQAKSQEADAARGQQLANTCMGCHGIDGYRNAYPSFRVPKLGGQKAEYIVIALNGYASEMRGHSTMHAQAATLGEQDQRDIAAYFAAQGDAKAGPVVMTVGKDKTATCAACHGEAGISAAPNWPSLAGQHKDYLVHAIQQYKSGVRKDPVMMGLAAALTDEDIDAIATHYAAQSGLFTVHLKN